MNVAGGTQRGVRHRGRGRGSFRSRAPIRPLNRGFFDNFSLGASFASKLKAKKYDASEPRCGSSSSTNNETITQANNAYFSGPPRIVIERSATTSRRSFPNYSSVEKSTNSYFSSNKNIDSCSNSKNITPLCGAIRSGKTISSRSRLNTGSSTSNISVCDSKIIVAITEGRGAAKGEVGIAAIDLKRPHLILCQLSDTHSYIHSLTKLNYFNPVEIIVPHTFNSGSVTSELYRLIRDQFPNANLVSIQRRCFSDSVGLQNIKELSAPEYMNIQLLIVHKFYALTAVSALLKYIENIQCIHFAPHSLKIEYHGSQNSTLIDVETCIRLELVESLAEISDRRCCLLSILNYTCTSGGLRNLRANILQPPCDEKVINCRLDCIDELLQNNDELLPTLKRVMRQFIDVDKILYLCMLLPVQDGNKSGEAQLNQTLQLKAAMDSLPSLIDALQMAKGRWFHKIKQDLEDPKFTEITESIKKVIQDDVHVPRGPSAHFQRCFAVRPNINGLLDVARKSYSELITDIQEKVTGLGEIYGLPLRLNCNSTKGFHIVLSIGTRNRNKFDAKDLPSVFFEVQNHGSTVTMTTEEIVLLDQQAKETLNEIQTMSNIIISGLLTDLRAYMSVLYKLCEHIAELDMILSLAQVSSSANYVRPSFNNFLELKDSIHPILECVLPTSPIPNDIFASPEFNFNIITGPNMGGKSIYIKQIALLQILAQMGCFVPATSAVFRIADNIFSRIGFNDSIECNASTYVLEMKEIQYIMKTLTPSSLIIVDELCRGTSSEEGTSMAWSICEYLLNTKAFTFFTTHFLYLTKLENVYCNVVNFHMDTASINNDTNKPKTMLVYKYKLLPGITNINNYGLSLAKNTNLPKNVISLAEDLIEIIEKQKKPLPVFNVEDKSSFLIYKLAANIINMFHKPDKSIEKYMDLIDHFKKENPQIMEKVLLERIDTDDKEATSYVDNNKNKSISRSSSTETSSNMTNDNINHPVECNKSINYDSFFQKNAIIDNSKSKFNFPFDKINSDVENSNSKVNYRIQKIFDKGQDMNNQLINSRFQLTNSYKGNHSKNITMLDENNGEKQNNYMSEVSYSLTDVCEKTVKAQDYFNRLANMNNYKLSTELTSAKLDSKDMLTGKTNIISAAKRQNDKVISCSPQDDESLHFFNMNLPAFYKIINLNDSNEKVSSRGTNENIDYESIFCEPDISYLDTSYQAESGHNATNRWFSMSP